MNLTHTPGPWTHKRIESSDDHTIVYCLIGPEKHLTTGRGIAYAGTYGKSRKLETVGIRQTDEECEANARLIAAAPDMLEALTAAMAWRNGLRNPDLPISEFPEMAIRTAIAKARFEL